MTQQEHDAAVAAFIDARGVTRCPTVCAVATHASIGETDRLALRRREEQREALRVERRLRQAVAFRFGSAA